jgi:hypothetical protein
MLGAAPLATQDAGLSCHGRSLPGRRDRIPPATNIARPPVKLPPIRSRLLVSRGAGFGECAQHVVLIDVEHGRIRTHQLLEILRAGGQPVQPAGPFPLAGDHDLAGVAAVSGHVEQRAAARPQTPQPGRLLAQQILCLPAHHEAFPGGHLLCDRLDFVWGVAGERQGEMKA